MNSSNILVVEDQISPLDSISYAIRKVILSEAEALPRFGNYTSEEVEKELRERKIDFARCYNEAQEHILNQTKNYDLVFLDHRMPYENCRELERIDSRSFSDRMHEIGYELIPSIRQNYPNVKIIGTSSLSELKLRFYEKPDFYLDKSLVRTIDKDLERILAQIKAR